MIKRLFQKCLLRPEDLTPSHDALEVVGTFNPAAIAFGDQVVLMVRVAERPRERREGYTALPKWDPTEGLTVDWISNEQVDRTDPRVVQRISDRITRLTFLSHLRVFTSRDGRTIDAETGVRLTPQTPYETFGVEDPRITRIGQTYYITYVAVSPHGAGTALASTTDFKTFTRHGIIFCPENKDVLLFPDTFDGQFLALHRPNPATHFSPPEIWLARSTDLIHWGRHRQLLAGGAAWQTDRIGGGVPPLKTERGYLEIYHGNQRPSDHSGVGAYSAGAVLMDLNDPSNIIGHSTSRIMAPQTDYERQGFVPNVVFPTGAVQRDDVLQVFYGAADTYTAVVELSLGEILASIR